MIQKPEKTRITTEIQSVPPWGTADLYFVKTCNPADNQANKPTDPIHDLLLDRADVMKLCAVGLMLAR